VADLVIACAFEAELHGRDLAGIERARKKLPERPGIEPFGGDQIEPAARRVFRCVDGGQALPW
jgi:hypothetical protein